MHLGQSIFLKGCLPQILLGPFLNTLSHLSNGWRSEVYLGAFQTSMMEVFAKIVNG